MCNGDSIFWGSNPGHAEYGNDNNFNTYVCTVFTSRYMNIQDLTIGKLQKV